MSETTSRSTMKIGYAIAFLLAVIMIVIDLFLCYQCVTATAGTCSLEWGSYVILAIFIVIACFSGYRLVQTCRMKPESP